MCVYPSVFEACLKLPTQLCTQTVPQYLCQMLCVHRTVHSKGVRYCHPNQRLRIHIDVVAGGRAHTQAKEVPARVDNVVNDGRFGRSHEVFSRHSCFQYLTKRALALGAFAHKTRPVQNTPLITQEIASVITLLTPRCPLTTPVLFAPTLAGTVCEPASLAPTRKRPRTQNGREKTRVACDRR